MNTLKESLKLAQINTKYLNLDAVYDYCGNDLIKFIKLSGLERSEEANNMYKKYKNNLVIRSFFRVLTKASPHIINYYVSSVNKKSKHRCDELNYCISSVNKKN